MEEKILTAAEIIASGNSPVEKKMLEKDEAPPETNKPEMEDKFVLLPNYNKNCNKCYGTGSLGQQVKGEEEYLPCPKCSKNAYMFLNIKTGSLLHDKLLGAN